MTIRRDGEQAGPPQRFDQDDWRHANRRAPEYLYESPVQQRLPINRLEKEQIARVAVLQLKPHQTIFLDGGTTWHRSGSSPRQEDAGPDCCDPLGAGVHGVRTQHGEFDHLFGRATGSRHVAV